MDEVRLYQTTLGEFMKKSLAMGRRLDKGDRSVEPAVRAYVDAEELVSLISPNRWTLVKTLRTSGPSSIRALAKRLGRDYRDVHADVTALIGADLIVKDDKAKVLVPWSKITAEMNVEATA